MYDVQSLFIELLYITITNMVKPHVLELYNI